MNLDQIQRELERFIVFSAESRPGVGGLLLLAALVAAAWAATLMGRWLLAYTIAVLRALIATAASLSALAVACLAVVVLLLTG